MEPASVTGLINFSLDAIILIYKFVTGVKRASGTVLRLQKELGALKSVLVLLDSILKKKQPALQQSSALVQAISKCKEELKNVQNTLDGVAKGQRFRKVLHKLKWPLDEDDTLKIVQTLHQYVDVFQLSLTVEGLSILCGSAAEAQKKLDSLDASVLGIDINVRDVKDIVASLDVRLRQLIHDEEYARFLNWLPTLDYQEKHLDTESRRLEGSGRWLLDGDAFRSWSEDSSSNSTLFCHGGPGVGKTFLTSLVIDRLQERREIHGDKVAYLYFDYKKHLDQNPVKVVSCLLRQILCQYPSTPKPASDLFERFKNGLGLPQWSRILGIIVDICSDPTAGKHFIVVDALDEYCEGESRVQLLNFVKALRGTHVRLFATSRPFPDEIMNAFVGASMVEVGASETDLESYLALKIKGATRLRAILKEQLISDVVNTVIEKAQGMFLLAALQIDYILGQTTAREIWSALKSLPVGLWANFEHTINRIKALPHHSQRELAFRTLLWISHSFRVLTVMEVQHAIATMQGARNISDDALVPDVLLVEYCLGLVTIDRGTATIRLAHFSIYEYLQQLDHCDLFGQAHAVITTTCLDYLMMDAFNEPCSRDLLPERRGECAFAYYAAQHWGNHAIRSQPCDIRFSVESFLRHSNALSWWSQFGFEPYGKGKSLDLRIGVAPLHALARFGLVDLLQTLPSDLFEDDFDCPTSFEETPLIIASEYGHTEFVRCMASGKRALGLNYADCTGRTALVWAVEKDHLEIARVLLGRPDLDVTKGLPLLQAVKDQNLKACIMLLERTDLDVNASDADGNTALHEAVQNLLDVNIIKHLVRREDLNIHTAKIELTMEYLLEDMHIMTTADLRAYPLIVREMATLCWKRAHTDGDVSLRWFTEWIPYRSCIVEDSVPAWNSQFLIQWLDEGFDGSIADEDGVTLLHVAAKIGNEVLAKKSMDYGISANAVTKSGQTPLHIAAKFDSESVIFVLFKYSTDLDVKTADGIGSTALHYAAEAGNESVCRSLIDKGADAKAVNGLGWTTLLSAAYGGNASIVRLLLEIGIDPNQLNKRGGSPLLCAIWDDRCVMARLPLDHGALVDIGRLPDVTPLHTAANRGHFGAVKLLLEYGAKPDPVSALYGTPLDRAAERMNGPIMSLLISNGADPTRAGPYGRTPLDWALRSESVSQMISLQFTESYKPTPKVRMLTRLRKRIEAVVTELLNGNLNYFTYRELGRVLLFLGNQQDALSAYEKEVSWDEWREKPIHGGAKCSLCSVEVEGLAFVCMECPLSYLCQSCFVKHPADKRTCNEMLLWYWLPRHPRTSPLRGLDSNPIDINDWPTEPDLKMEEDPEMHPTQKIPWCSANHVFLGVPGRAWMESEGASAMDDEAFEAWLRGLRERYAREDELGGTEDADEVKAPE